MMRIKIRKADCFFKVDEENRKVVCVYKADPNLAEDYIYSFNQEHGLPTYIPIDNKMYIPLHTIGVATCAEGDTWNERIGREVAYAKMKNKFGKNFFRAMNTYFKFHDKNLNALQESVDHLGLAWHKNLVSQDKLINQLIEDANK